MYVVSAFRLISGVSAPFFFCVKRAEEKKEIAFERDRQGAFSIFGTWYLYLSDEVTLGSKGGFFHFQDSVYGPQSVSKEGGFLLR